MTRRKTMTITNFVGVDQRRPLYSMDPKAIFVGDNVELTRGNTIRTAPIAKVEAVLPANSIGLYEADGKLRSAVPAGNGLEGLAPYNFVFDAISDLDAGSVSLTKYVGVTASTTSKADSIGRSLPYLVVETISGGYEHHYIDGEYNTRVLLPFPPGPSLAKQSGKLFAANVAEGLVHFSATTAGPRVWDFNAGQAGEDDAGFIDVTNYAAGDSRIRGLQSYGRSQLSVFFRDSIQFWVVDPIPAAFQYQDTLDGPGTQYFGSVERARSDMYFFSSSGFHSTQAAFALGDTAEGDIGSKVFEQTKGFNDGTYNVVSFWSQFRSQYITFFSKDGACTAFVYNIAPLGGTSGWSRWTLDFEVEYATEVDDKLYVRSGNTVYRFDDSDPNDDLGFTWRIETPMYDGGEPRRLKEWQDIEFSMEGTIDLLEYRSDTQDTTKTWTGARNIVDSTAPGGSLPIEGVSHALGLIMTGTKGLELSDITIDFLDYSGLG